MPKSNLLSKEDRELIKKLYAEGMKPYKIAARLDVAPNTVRYHLGMIPAKAAASR